MPKLLRSKPGVRSTFHVLHWFRSDKWSPLTTPCNRPFIYSLMQCPLFSNYSVLPYFSLWPVLSRKQVHVGSRLGLVMDTDRSLHLYADGKDQGVVACHSPDPCYFMFDLSLSCTKVFFHCFCFISRHRYCSCCCRCCCFMFTVFLILLYLVCLLCADRVWLYN